MRKVLNSCQRPEGARARNAQSLNVTGSIATWWALYRVRTLGVRGGLIVFLCFCNFRGFDMLGRKRAHGGREGFKRFLEAVGSILAEFEPKPSHGDPIRDQNYGFGACDMCWNIDIDGKFQNL